MTRQDKAQLRSLANRYIKVDREMKDIEAKKKKLGQLLQQEMEDYGITIVEGTVANISLISGSYITKIPAAKFYKAVPKSMQPRAWKALSVLVQKARKLVGEDVLRKMGKSVPFTRLLIKRKSNIAQLEEAA